ncbi:MAG: acetyl-CoA decarbonylase/synthase complex subunit gamma, partial [Endomicrobia bacterium]|nr:acetyl-CoA decarbonylase/synthase complex subunit gamma [Endomicrobiia bacterium]
MALTGLEIYKLLPKTNCKKCGFPTCLAFAMALAAKKISLDKCPDVSEETKKILAEASEPPIRTINIADKYKIGGETVLFRHEKTFYNPALLSVLIKDTLDDNEIKKRIAAFQKLEFDRVGQKYRTELLVLKCEQNNFERIKNIIQNISYEIPVGVLCNDPSVGEEIIKIRKIVFLGVVENKNQAEKFVSIAKQNNIPLVIGGNTLDEIIDTTNSIV